MSAIRTIEVYGVTATAAPCDSVNITVNVEPLTLAMKLHAMLDMTYGGAGEAFRDMADGLQDQFLWACGDLSTQLLAALELDLRVRVEI